MYIFYVESFVFNPNITEKRAKFDLTLGTPKNMFACYSGPERF